MRAGIKTKISWNDRPHPGPLLRGEGESFAVSLKIHTTGFAGRSSAKPKLAGCHFLSPGERIKGEGELMRAGVKTQISWNDRPHPGPLLRGEGESFAVFLKIHTTGFAGRSSTKPKLAGCHFLSPGERIKGEGELMRAGVKTQISWNDRPHPGPLLRGEGESSAASLKIHTTGFAGHNPQNQNWPDAISSP